MPSSRQPVVGEEFRFRVLEGFAVRLSALVEKSGTAFCFGSMVDKMEPTFYHARRLSQPMPMLHKVTGLPRKPQRLAGHRGACRLA